VKLQQYIGARAPIYLNMEKMTILVIAEAGKIDVFCFVFFVEARSHFQYEPRRETTRQQLLGDLPKGTFINGATHTYGCSWAEPI